TTAFRFAAHAITTAGSFDGRGGSVTSCSARTSAVASPRTSGCVLVEFAAFRSASAARDERSYAPAPAASQPCGRTPPRMESAHAQQAWKLAFISRPVLNHDGPDYTRPIVREMTELPLKLSELD